MKRYFFYTDPTVLNPQTPNQAIGPSQPGIVGHSDVEKQKDKYQITNLHIDANAPAIAIAIAIYDGTICVQIDSPNTFGIILYPDYQPSFDFPHIKYFIYKVIKKESLIKVESKTH